MGHTSTALSIFQPMDIGEVIIACNNGSPSTPYTLLEPVIFAPCASDLVNQLLRVCSHLAYATFKSCRTSKFKDLREFRSLLDQIAVVIGLKNQYFQHTSLPIDAGWEFLRTAGHFVTLAFYFRIPKSSYLPPYLSIYPICPPRPTLLEYLARKLRAREIQEFV